MFKFFIIALLPLSMMCGCAPEATPDSNVAVFKTPDEVAADRRAQQERNWKNTAIEVLHDERPDVSAQAEDGLSIVISADAVRQRVDLSELAPSLTAQPDQSIYILREYLARQLANFDQQRLVQTNYESIKSRIRPMLVNGNDVQELSRLLAENSQLPTRTVIGDLYWIPVVRWEGTRPAIPIGPAALASWHISAEQAQRQALSNLAGDPVANTFEITSFGTLGKIGTLKSGVDPSILLSPNFLPAARQALGSSDDLAILMTTPQDVRFMEAGNKKLIDGLYPSWKHVITNNRKALASRPLMLSDRGILPLNYTPQVLLIGPTSKPASSPLGKAKPGGPATRPSGAKPAGKPYIVR